MGRYRSTKAKALLSGLALFVIVHSYSAFHIGFGMNVLLISKKRFFNKSGAREGVYFAVDIVVVIFFYRGILITIIKA